MMIVSRMEELRNRKNALEVALHYNQMRLDHNSVEATYEEIHKVNKEMEVLKRSV